MAAPANPAELMTQMMLQNAPKTPLEMRRMLDGFAPFMNTELPEVGGFHEAVPVREGVTADVVIPKGAGPHPVLVYLHGGGWVCGSPKTHRKLGYRFAEAGYLVVNVDYRLAPEHPFPTPFEDCLAAVRWAHREAARFGGDPARFAIGGDSAGGNLSAAVAAALAGDAARPQAALLIYGVFDFGMFQGELPAFASASREAVAIGRELVEMMVGAYLGKTRSEAVLRDARVSPLYAAEKLPPSHIVVGSADDLAPQSEALVKALGRAGVAHEHFVDADMPHGYAQLEMLPAARPAIDRMVAFLRKHL
jgi:acetyl esterase